MNDRGRSLRGARVGILGVAFKANVRDARNAPAASIMAHLLRRGAVIAYHDPHVPGFLDEAGGEHHSVELDDLLSSSDVVVIVTPHRNIDWEIVFNRAALIVDTVNVSSGRSLHPRQVLRLGAGWSSAIL